MRRRCRQQTSYQPSAVHWFGASGDVVQPFDVLPENEVLFSGLSLPYEETAGLSPSEQAARRAHREPCQWPGIRL